LVEEAMEFLRVEGRKRWFLYLHMMDVHEYTYDPESAQFGTSNSDVYDNAILHVDHTLDQLFGRLAAGNYLKNTLVVIVADHGEAHGERAQRGAPRRPVPLHPVPQREGSDSRTALRCGVGPPRAHQPARRRARRGRPAARRGRPLSREPARLGRRNQAARARRDAAQP